MFDKELCIKSLGVVLGVIEEHEQLALSIHRDLEVRLVLAE
jgi:hypothetical protein